MNDATSSSDAPPLSEDAPSSSDAPVPPGTDSPVPDGPNASGPADSTFSNPDAAGGPADALSDGSDAATTTFDAACLPDGDTSGVTHEPPGMTVQLDTGPLTVSPPASGSWNNGNVTFKMFSPVTPTSTGESSANLVRVPCGSGLRLLYGPSLAGGNSPVRFGTSVASPGTTTYYQRWRVRTVPNWAGPRNGNGVKMCEPQARDQGSGSGSGTNDILMMWPNGGSNDQMSAMEGLQGPNGHFRNLGVNQGLVASLSDGQWHWDERIYVAESTPGKGDGQYYAYYDGALVAKYPDVLWLAPGGTWGITSWIVDPTFGGAPAKTHPLSGEYWDFDQLYVSTK